MHRNVTHNKCYATCAQFADATLGFLREQVPRNWAHFCDSVTDNFRVISPKNFLVMTGTGYSFSSDLRQAEVYASNWMVCLEYNVARTVARKGGGKPADRKFDCPGVSTCLRG